MNLKETPYIKLRKANGLTWIDYTQCDILTLEDDRNTSAARSYNTIIGIYTDTINGEKVYLETSGVYSTTTAAKHKPRAAAIAAYNNYRIIPEVKPEILHDIYFYEKYSIEAILKEYQERQEISAAIETRNPDHYTILDARTKGQIKPAGLPKTTNYKNGNRLVKYYYKTNFQYFQNIYYQVNQKATRRTINKGTKGNFITNSYKESIVNIRW